MFVNICVIGHGCACQVAQHIDSGKCRVPLLRQGGHSSHSSLLVVDTWAGGMAQSMGFVHDLGQLGSPWIWALTLGYVPQSISFPPCSRQMYGVALGKDSRFLVE
jgi:hypothetical protein